MTTGRPRRRGVAREAGTLPARRLRIAHLFPDLLRVYGDAGNVRTLAYRARSRGIEVEAIDVLAGDQALPSADVYVIGGGQDRDQEEVDRTLRRLAEPLVREIERGAAILAICGGYQCLGLEYRAGGGATMHGPGLFPVRTEAGPNRLVGPVVAALDRSIVATGRRTVVGFENHSGRTLLEGRARPLAEVEVGFGNNGEDGGEGLVALPGDGGLRGLRIGTYLHGPILPRNPHVADALLAAGLAGSGQPVELAPLDDADEWRAHERYVERLRRRSLVDRLPRPMRRVVSPVRDLIGF